MKYCMKCGVSVDEEVNRSCPLCQTIILKDQELDSLSIQEISISKVDKREKNKLKEEKKEKLNNLGMISFIVFFISLISILILLLIDFLIGFNIDWSLIPIISITLFVLVVNVPLTKSYKPIYWFLTLDTILLVSYFLLMNIIINDMISWSYYVALSILLVWVYLTSIFVTKIKGFVLKLSLDFLGTAIYVLLILSYNQHSGFSKLALPINALVFIVTVISYLFIKTYVYNWRAIISTISINASILCLGVDLIIQKYIYNRFSLNWSYIVILVIVPLTLFMFYLDNQYKVHSYLKKKFHI